MNFVSWIRAGDLHRITNGVAMLVGRNQLSNSALRDNPDCAKQEFEVLQDAADPGLNMKIGFSLTKRLMCLPRSQRWPYCVSKG